MNPVAPISMLAGKGSGKALLVLAIIAGLVVYAVQQQQPTKPPQ